MSFKEVNVQEDPVAGDKLVETTGQMGVPQIEISGEWVLGYDPETITQLLEE